MKPELVPAKLERLSVTACEITNLDPRVTQLTLSSCNLLDC